MGFFKKFKKVAKRAVTGIATGGISEIIRAAGGKSVAKNLESAFTTGGLNAILNTVAPVKPKLPAAAAFGNIEPIDNFLSTTPLALQPIGGNQTMGLFKNISNILGSTFGVLENEEGAIGTAAQIGSRFFQTTQQAPAPINSNLIAAGPVMGGMAAVPAGVDMFMANTQAILIRMATKLGLRTLTLRKAISIIRRLGRTLAPPAIAANLGLNVAQLGQLIVADQRRAKRRMNPGNAAALRRAARRIESFHNLVRRTEKLRSPRRKCRTR